VLLAGDDHGPHSRIRRLLDGGIEVSGQGGRECVQRRTVESDEGDRTLHLEVDVAH